MLAELRQRTDQAASQIQEWKGRAAQAASLVESERATAARLAAQVALKESVTNLLKAMAENLWGESKTVIESVVTQGLRFVFEEPLTFKAEFSTVRNNASVEFLINKDGQDRDILEDMGGGIADVVSMLLRVAVILLTPGISRVVALDEPAKMLSAEYVPKLAEFLRMLAQEFGLQFVVITHNPDLATIGTAYIVTNRNGSTNVTPTTQRPLEPAREATQMEVPNA